MDNFVGLQCYLSDIVQLKLFSTLKISTLNIGGDSGGCVVTIAVAPSVHKKENTEKAKSFTKK